MNEFVKRATDPSQYDFGDMNWDKDSEIYTPIRQFFYGEIGKRKAKWKGLDVLDLGCGSGWLLARMKEDGARTVEGFDPSERNVQMAAQLYPEIKVHKATLDSYGPSKQYDLITSVMVFGHIENLDSAFEKIKTMLKDGGEFYLIAHDYDYNKLPRYDYEVQVKDLTVDSYVTMTKRNQGTISDIVRRTSLFEDASKRAGLELVEDFEMRPTELLIRDSPRYESMRGVVLTHFLRFKKS